MPVSVNRDPFGAGQPARSAANPALRTPQARVLAAIQPDDPGDPAFEWPILTRARLAVRAGYTAISGTVTRALNGIRAGSSSGDAHPGLLALGYIEEVVLDIEGVSEVNYRATTAGVRAYQLHLATVGQLPKVKDAVVCTNTTRGYRVGENPQGGRKR